MYNTIVINAFGGAGAGKTTACFYLACELKKRGYVAEYVPEYAKELVWDKNMEMLDGTVKNQSLLFVEQKKRIDRLIGQVEFIVTDSPILLNGIYLKDCPEKAQYCENVLVGFKKYNNFNVVVQRDSTKFEQAGRIHTLEQSIEIDKQVEKLLSDNGLYFGTYTHSKLPLIVENIIKSYEKQNSIIGNAPYSELGDKAALQYYGNLDNAEAQKISKELDAAGIKHSGVVKDKTTLTVNKKDASAFEQIRKKATTLKR